MISYPIKGYKFFVLLLFCTGFNFFSSCHSRSDYKQALLSDYVGGICEASFQLGEAKDTSAVKFLLTKILDGRASTHISYKGMSACYCRLVALRKISGIVPPGGYPKEHDVDTMAVNFYLNWAVEKGYLKNRNEVNIYYSK